MCICMGVCVCARNEQREHAASQPHARTFALSSAECNGLCRHVHGLCIADRQQTTAAPSRSHGWCVTLSAWMLCMFVCVYVLARMHGYTHARTPLRSETPESFYYGIHCSPRAADFMQATLRAKQAEAKKLKAAKESKSTSSSSSSSGGGTPTQ